MAAGDVAKVHLRRYFSTFSELKSLTVMKTQKNCVIPLLDRQRSQRPRRYWVHRVISNLSSHVKYEQCVHNAYIL